MIDRASLLCAELPHPAARYRTDEAEFEVYRARSWYSRWHDPVLEQIVLLARDAYRRYGRRPALDPYDEKAAIYLVRATYPQSAAQQEIAQEWLCVRLVPGSGQPLGVGEPEIYFSGGRSLDQWLQERMAVAGTSFWKHIVSSSRMCSIRPHCTATGEELASRNRYTAISFSLIHAQFLLDYPLALHPYRIITAIIRPELITKRLAVRKDGREFRPTFCPARQFFGLSSAAEISLDRSVYAYRFPSYWFDVAQLTACVEELLAKGDLSRQGLEHYVGDAWGTVVSLQRLGDLLTVDGQIFGSQMTGAALRAIVDARVRDVPELNITPTPDWNRGILSVLEAAGIDIFAQHPALRYEGGPVLV
ncbi:hypothetical protein HY442_02440 [Candidatus Parcubacteria bacterium]|nr:hypothetical protein [Candidatus Parcubacteria bacterium]